MKRPSFQFYPADWRTNTNLRRCSDAARGIWMDVLCTLHDQDEYGVVRWPLIELAQVAAVPLKLLKELVAKSVLKGSDKGQVSFVHTPRHAGKDGDPVLLISAEGPCWYSSRMVRDEWRRSVSGGQTRFSADNQAAAKKTANVSPSRTPSRRQGDDLGDGASSSTSSSDSSLREESLSRDLLGTNLPSKPITSEPPGFSEFYEAFPLKKARPKAAEAYARALKKADAATLLAAARRFAVTRKGEDPKFTAHPATWLNQERWADEGLAPMSTGADRAAENSGHIQKIGESQDHFMVRRFKETGYWAGSYGPKPTDPHCDMPEKILIEFGYRDKVSRETTGGN